MPSEVSTASTNEDLAQRVKELERNLAEARRREDATAEVLKIISSSPTDLKPVLAAVAENAARLCTADDGHIWQRDGVELQVAASWGELAPPVRRRLTITRQSVVGRSVHDQVPVHVEDLAEAFYTEFPDSQAMKEMGWRTILAIPLLRKGESIGAIMIRRAEVRPFSDQQIALLKTFADQAVIAIENTRLFEQVQESLEYQIATSDVLNVISRSPTNVQPVFDMIAQSAARLCKARFCRVYRFDGQLVYFVASHGLSPSMRSRRPPIPPGRGFAAARAILNNSVVEIPDLHADPAYVPADIWRAEGYQSAVAVPMQKDGHPIGAIAVARWPTGRFPKRQIELLKTFADQAVIAIENTRLFEEVQARTRELTEALEYQRATGDVLSVISRSPSQLKPVLD